MSPFATDESPNAVRSTWRQHQRGTENREHDLLFGLSASFTIDPIVPYLGTMALASGYGNPQIRLADYNQILQTCMNHRQAFEGLEPDVIVIPWRLEDLGDTLDVAGIQEARDLILAAIGRLREQFDGTIIICGPARPRPLTGVMSGFSRQNRLDCLWHETMLRLDEFTSTQQRVYWVDIEDSVAHHGLMRATDERKAFLYRQPYTEAVYQHLAGAIMRVARGRRFEGKKCLVLDCDNTLWGGVVGEDGVGGIALGQDFPGSAYREFQRQVKILRDSGIFVALNSKNNEEDVWEVFDAHQDMVLKREDISVACINWQPKSDNIKVIAEELNIGIDSLVFVDDSSFELAEVGAALPQVTLIQVPEDVAMLTVRIREHAHLFDRLDITDDDLKRVDMMRSEQQRREASVKMTESDFLASLGLEAFIYEPAEADYARVVQLINKTNQFNVTTRRYTAEDLMRFVKAPDWGVYCLTVRDKFGDYGLVGIAIVKYKGDAAEVDTLLMSCRVLARGVETALINHIAQSCTARGIARIDGFFIPTTKNRMVAELFARHGFDRIALPDGRDLKEGTTAWQLNVDNAIMAPSFLAVTASRPA